MSVVCTCIYKVTVAVSVVCMCICTVTGAISVTCVYLPVQLP